MNFHSLKIIKIVSETEDTKSLSFEIPSDIKQEYSHLAGQYLTLKATINGKEIRRAYSICSEPDASAPTVTVKRVKNGVMSNFITDDIKEGDYMDVMTPDGNFIIQPVHNLSRAHYFICAGSGITPVLSMIQTILEHEPKSICYLLYGNRSENNIIFKEKLDSLIKKYEDQLFVEYVLSQPNTRKEGGFVGLFSKKVMDWSGYKGRVDEVILSDFLSKYESKHNQSHYYLCGPGDLIDKTNSFLINRNVDKQFIHKEYFSSGSLVKPTASGIANGIVSVTLKGETFDIAVPKGKTILDVLVDLKKDPPYSCTSGACSTCMAKVTEGTVKMDSCYALDEDEVAAGYILTCQSHPDTEKVVLTYDV